MSERVKVTSKTPESKRDNSVSQTRKTDFSQSLRSPVDQILSLQRTIGNQAVQRLFNSGVIQAKLKIGQPNDIYEQEADRVAEQVMRMPEPRLQRQAEEEEEEELIQTKPLAEQITPLVQRQVEEEEEEEEELIQTKEISGQTPQVTPNIESKINTLRGAGQPLPKETRNFFEPRFGHDFSGVRVHTDSNANQLARSINAKAFTRGSDIVFGGGEYSPESSSGKRLIGHELTHVVQQKGLVTVQRKGEKGGKGRTIFKKTKYKSYAVKGKTLKEAVEDMEKIHGEETGKCEWSPNLQYEYDENGTITKAKVEVETTITMPKWPGAKKLSKPAMAEWSRFYKALKKHEKGHADIVRKKLKGLGAKLVGKSKKDAEAAYKKALEDLQKASDAYDAITDHGYKQGTVIDVSK
jgi:predicted secreted Zn-dependent protease